MTLRTVLRTATLAAGACALLASAAAAQQTPKHNWKLTTYVPEGTSTYRDYIQVFIDHAHAITDGEVRIQGFGVGVIAGFADTWKAVQQGTADTAYAYPGFGLNIDPVNAIFGGFPGGMTADAMMHWVYHGDGLKIWNEFRRATTGLHSVVTGTISTEIFLHSHKKVETIDDLKGMKIRTAGAWADILKAFGATPTIIAPADIFSALERKIVDGTEFITPASNVSQGFHRIARYIILPGIHAPAGLNEVVWKAEVWDALPKSLQQRLTMAGQLAGFETYLRTGMGDIAAIEEMKKGRNEWVTLKPEFLKAVRDEGRKWAFAKAKEQSDKGNPWMQRIADSYFAFLDRWEANTEYRLK
ncbi:MAG: C4-dicarboxylate ABC transporter substrate-binding protein [Alphaproteobacteria bacterium]|nr:C4-dicarboxylate ABC transporter substrate-binding protein [Alphaproteobacteria bacterium]